MDMSFHSHKGKEPEREYEMSRMTENLNLQRALVKNFDHGKTEALHLIDNAKVNSIEKEPSEFGGWPLVHVSNGRTLRARLLVSRCSLSFAVLHAYRLFR